MNFRRLITYFLSMSLALPAYGGGNKKSDRKESVQAVEVQDKSESVDPMALLFKMQFGGDDKDLLVKFARSSIIDLNSVNPQQIESMWKAAKDANTLNKTLVRFPSETLMFYSVIAFNSLVKSKLISLKSGYETDPAPLKTLENMFKDPVGLFSFLIFVTVNGGTNFYGADLVKWSMQTVARNNALRLGIINEKGDALKPEAAEYIKKFSLDKSYFQTTKMIQAAIPALGMSFGMLASRLVESAFHDSNIQTCSAGLVNHGDDNWLESCRLAYDLWVKDGKVYDFFLDFGSLFLAAGSARGIIENAKMLLRKTNTKSAEALVKGIEYEFGFSQAKGSIKYLSKIKSVGNLLVKPLSPGNMINTALFLALDGVYSEYTKPVKTAERARELIYQLADVEGKMSQFKKDLKNVGPSNLGSTCDQNAESKISWNCFFDRVFVDNRDLADDLARYSSHLDEFREFQLAEASAINTNWLHATNELVSVYQETHEFYKNLLEAKAKTQLGINREISPFEVRDFFSGVNVYLDGKPLAVNYLDDQIAPGITIDKLLDAKDMPPRLKNRFILDEKLKTLKTARLMLENYVGFNANEKSKIVEIVNYLRAADYDLPASSVLTEKEMRTLYAIKAPKDEYTSRFYNSDYRGIKELDLRLLRANYGLDLLDKAIAEFPKKEILTSVRNFIGGHNSPMLPGIKYLDTISQDASIFSPAHADFYPNSFLHINGLDRAADYLVANMICGATPEEQKNSKTPYIEKPWLYSYEFTPPAIVSNWGDARKQFCENKNNYKHVFYNDTLNFRNKQYNGIFDLIADNLNSDLVGYADNKGRLKFTDWWQANIRPSMEKFLTDHHAEYRKALADSMYPALFSSAKLEDDKFNSVMTNLMDPFLMLKTNWQDLKDILASQKSASKRPLSVGVLDSLEEEADMYLNLSQEIMINLKSKMHLTEKPFDFDSYRRNFNLVYKHVLKKVYGPNTSDWSQQFNQISKQIDDNKPFWEAMWRKEYEASKTENENRFAKTEGDFTKALEELDKAAKAYRTSLHARHKSIQEAARLSRITGPKSLESVRADLDKQSKGLEEATKALMKFTGTGFIDLKTQKLADGSSSEVGRVLETSILRLNNINLKSMAYAEILFMWAKELY